MQIMHKKEHMMDKKEREREGESERDKAREHISNGLSRQPKETLYSKDRQLDFL